MTTVFTLPVVLDIPPNPSVVGKHRISPEDDTNSSMFFKQRDLLK